MRTSFFHAASQCPVYVTVQVGNRILTLMMVFGRILL